MSVRPHPLSIQLRQTEFMLAHETVGSGWLEGSDRLWKAGVRGLGMRTRRAVDSLLDFKHRKLTSESSIFRIANCLESTDDENVSFQPKRRGRPINPRRFARDLTENCSPQQRICLIFSRTSICRQARNE